MISGKTALRWLSHFDLWSPLDCRAVDRNDTFLTEKSVARHYFNFAYMENFVRSQTSANSVTQYDCVVLLISLWSSQPNCLHQFLYSNKIFFLVSSTGRSQHCLHFVGFIAFHFPANCSK